MKLVLVLVLVLVLGAPPVAAETIALVGGRVITLAGPRFDSATVVIRDGKIASVGSAAPPAGARVIDVSGRTVTPGLVAAETRLGVAEIDLEASTRDHSVAERDDDQNHAALRISDALNPRSAVIPVQRLEGVTSAVSTPDGGIVCGQSAWIDLARPDRARMLVRASLAMTAQLGNVGATAAGGSRAYALTRLREMLDDARVYQKARDRFERNQSRRMAGSRLDLEALGPVVRGQQPLYVRADREADLLALLELAREQKVKLVIGGAAEAWRVAARLAAARVPVLIDPVENLPAGFDTLGSRLDHAAVLHRAGVRVAFMVSGETHNARTLRQRAGIAASMGLPQEEALAAASRNVAAAFGMDGEYGTLEPGKVANVVVWSGDPLELSTQVTHVFVQGEELPLRSRQTELRDRYRTLPASPGGSASPAASPF